MIWNIQLVFDATDADEIMWFWGPKLDYKQEHMPPAQRKVWRKEYPQFDGRGRIDDADARRMPIYIQEVPEPKQGPNRVRLEIESPDEEPAEHADPEGNEYSVVRGSASRLKTIVFDGIDEGRMLEFWSAATGYRESDGRLDHDSDAFRIESGHFFAYGQPVHDLMATNVLGFREPKTFPDGVVHDLIPGIAFRETGEEKRYKNRLHLDLRPFDREAERARLEQLGATVVRWDTDHVMADPEGNEFCVG